MRIMSRRRPSSPASWTIAPVARAHHSSKTRSPKSLPEATFNPGSSNSPKVCRGTILDSPSALDANSTNDFAIANKRGTRENDFVAARGCGSDPARRGHYRFRQRTWERKRTRPREWKRTRPRVQRHITQPKPPNSLSSGASHAEPARSRHRRRSSRSAVAFSPSQPYIRPALFLSPRK